MKKAYVITKGYYSDYRICAVTLDEEIAKKLKIKFDDSMNEANIEIYDLDEYNKDNVDYNSYSVRFNFAGDIQEVRVNPDDYEERIYEKYGLVVELRAKDINSAIKIAAERRAMWLAQKEGI